MNKRKRRTVIAGNWKMNMTPDEAAAMIKELRPMIKGRRGCDVVLCVPAIDIPAAVAAARGSRIKIGAENVHFVGGEGFVEDDVEATIKNMGYIGKVGMKDTDREILNVMIDKVDVDACL